MAKKQKKSKAKKSNKLDVKKDFDKPVKRKPRQSRLPGMEDSQIKDLEEAAIEHSEIRSEIVAVRARLKDSEKTIARLMKENGKTKYNHNGITLKVREGQDTVSVQVKRHDLEDKNPAEGGEEEESGT